MKKALLIGLAMLFVASAVNAGEFSYIGLFSDDAHSLCSVMSPGGFFPFRMYVWILPGVNGMQAAEWMIAYPANVIGSTVTQNPAITVALGSLNAGISVAFGECNTQWVWTHYQDCYLTSLDATIIEIVPHPTAFAYQVATCELGYPIEPAIRLTHLYMNQPCVYAVEDATWGSIKSLF